MKSMGATDPSTDKVRTILIVEDDSTFRRLLARTLATQGFQIREAESGLVAKTIYDLAPENYDAIISDVRMPGMDGVELLKHVRSKAQTPFIVMTGFSEVLNTVTAFELGANEFVPKPFRIDVLLNALLKCFAPVVPKLFQDPQATAHSPEETQYCPIHVNEFISSSELHSDIFIKIGDSRFIKVAYKGESTPVDRLKVYQEKAVEYLYVAQADFAKYVKFNIQVAHSAVSSSRVAQEKKIAILRHTTELIVEQCYLTGLTAEQFKPAQNLVETTLNLLAEDNDLLELFRQMSERSDRLYAHSVAVAIFSAMTAHKHGWFSTPTLFKIVTSALLHDIGKKEISAEIIKKRRVLRTQEETTLLESHSTRGRDLVGQLKSLPEEIAQIVHHHHETGINSGYPRQVSPQEIHPLARLIGTVDAFVELILPISPETTAVDSTKALQWLAQEAKDKTDGAYLVSLGDALGKSFSASKKAA